MIPFWGRLGKLSCGAKTAFTQQIKARFPALSRQDGAAPVTPDSLTA